MDTLYELCKTVECHEALHQVQRLNKKAPFFKISTQMRW